MRIIKKTFISVLLSFAILFTTSSPSLGNAVIAQAATIKISNKTLELKVSETKNLTLKGTKKKITWTSDDDEVATVSKKGLVTAVAPGSTVITATVSKKKYSCKVIVTKPENPFIKDAPFSAMEVDLGSMSFVMPSDWDGDITNESDTETSIDIAPIDTNLKSSINISVFKTDEAVPDYTEFKNEILVEINLDALQKKYTEAIDPSVKVENFVQVDLDTTVAKILKTTYEIIYEDTKIQSYVYDFCIDGYFIQVTTADASNQDLAPIAEYMISSIALAQ